MSVGLSFNLVSGTCPFSVLFCVVTDYFRSSARSRRVRVNVASKSFIFNVEVSLQ